MLSRGVGISKYSVSDFAVSYHSSKGSTLSKRTVRKGDDGRNFEMRDPFQPEDMERNQKIMQWMMEGEKEAGRYKRSPYG